jgi:hypothetical protein
MDDYYIRKSFSYLPERLSCMCCMHIIDKSDRYTLQLQITVLFMGFGQNMDFEYREWKK